MKFELLAGPSVGNVFVVRNWYETDTQTEKRRERRRERWRERRRERRRERQRHKLMTSWLLELPPKVLEATR